MIEVTEDDFNVGKILNDAKHPDNGAIVTFLGIVRDDGISGMEIEAYTDLALRELDKIEKEALERFNIRSLDVIHRTGTLSVGDNILLIVCGAPHRKDAFAACEYMIDELKERVHVWKKELHKGGAGGKWVGAET